MRVDVCDCIIESLVNADSCESIVTELFIPDLTSSELIVIHHVYAKSS